MKKKKLSGLSLNKKTVTALNDSVAHRLKGGITENAAACAGTQYVSCARDCNGGYTYC